MSGKKILCISFVLLCTLLLAAGCGGKKSAAPAGESKLVIAQGSDALFLDPQQQDETPTNSVCSNIYDPLVMKNPDLSITAGLAESWEQKDSLTWVFHLRPNVTFHNGDKLTADDVVFTIERFKKQRVAGTTVDAVDTVRKIDDSTVEIKTRTPYAPFLKDLSKVYIIDKKYVTEVGDEQFNLKPVGTGPYKVVEWVKEDHITMQANENYWRGPAEIKTVIFRPISNEATRTAALLSGDVQLITDIPVRDVDRVAKSSKLKVVQQPSLRLIYMHVDVTRDKTPGIDLPVNPFKDPRVRQAARMGLDLDSIVKNIMNGHAYVALQGNTQQVAGYAEDIPKVPYDPEKAKQLLAEAGYPDGFTVTLDAPNNRYPNDFKVAEAIASQWAKIGINVKLNLMPKSLFFDYVRPGDKTTMCLTGWSSDTGDAGLWYRSMFYTRNKQFGYGASNRGHYSSAAFDTAIDNANATADMAERTKYLQEATRILDKDMACLPLYFQEDTYGVVNYVDFTPRLDEMIYAYDIHFKK